MSDWWIDLIALPLLLLFVLLLFLVETSRLGGPQTSALDPGPPQRRPRIYPANLIRQCGLNPEAQQLIYWLSKLLLGMLAPLLLLELLLGQAPGWGLAISAALGFSATDLWLLARRRRRRAEIGSSLSFLISLIVVYLRSGMPLTHAFRQAASHGLPAGHPLADEVALLGREIEAGRDRDEAFTLLAERTGVEALRRLAAIIHVGLTAGAPITDTLQAQADLLKTRQLQLVTEQIQRRSMEAMLPMLLICFPVFLVLVLFPAVIQLSDVLNMIGDLF